MATDESGIILRFRRCPVRNFCLLLLLTLPGWCQPGQPGQPVTLTQPAVLPDMRGIPEFSERSNFLSLAGYLRQQAYQSSGQWMTRQESLTALDQQVESVLEGASR